MNNKEAIESLVESLKFKEEELEGFKPNNSKFDDIRLKLQIEIEALKIGIEALKVNEKRFWSIILWTRIIKDADAVGSARIWAYKLVLENLIKCGDTK